MVEVSITDQEITACGGNDHDDFKCTNISLVEELMLAMKGIEDGSLELTR
jgi:hypothetical protein